VLDGGARGVQGLRAVARRVRSWRWPGWLVVGSAALLALGLRLLGIRLGLPFFHHWDECWVVDSSKKMLQTDDWEPATYQYGAPLSAITAWIWVTISELWPRVHFYDPGDGITMRLIARIVTAVISSTGAGGVYLAARYATPGDDAGRVRGAYAAILYATAAELVSHGRYAVTDADLVAWVAWSLGACALFLRTGAFVWAVGTLLFAAMAVSFKVTAATALAIPALAFMLRAVTVPGLRAPAWGRGAMLAAIPLAVAFFLLMNPHVAIHWQNALHDIQNRSRQTIEGGFPLFLLRTPGWDHVRSVLEGLALLALHRWLVPAVVAASCAIIGLALALRQRSMSCLVGIGHAVVAILSIALTSRAYLFRNYLVTVPILCVGFGFTMQATTAAMGSWARQGGERARLLLRLPWIAAAFAIVYVAVPIGQAVRTQKLSLDARDRALNWISSQAGSHGVTVACTPDIISMGGYQADWLRDKLKRPGLHLASDVKDADEAARSHADYILIVSHADGNDDWGDMWPFTAVKGYESVARFDASPYEHRFDITAGWAGRFNVILLKRAESHGA
jgi:hypothetical protein